MKAVKMRTSTAVALGVTVVVFCGVAIAAALSGSSSADNDQSGYVKVACHGWVKDRLKSPSSAKFSADTATRTGNTYVIRGNVDSQNAFGAMIRNTYVCEATNDGSQSVLVGLTGLEN